MVRVRIQCKDPTKIPRKRIFVFKQQVYLIQFKPEGFEQADIPPEDGGQGQDGSIEELEDEDDDLLDDEPKENDQPPEGEPNGAQGSGQTSNDAQGKKEGSVGTSSVRRVLNFNAGHIGQKASTMDCLQLLQAMELNEQEDKDLEEQSICSPAPMIQDDDGSIQLPEEWIFELQDRSQLQSSTADASINVSSTFGEHSQKTAGCREML